MTKPKSTTGKKKLTVKKSSIKDLAVGEKGGKVKGGEPAAGQSVQTYCYTKCPGAC